MLAEVDIKIPRMIVSFKADRVDAKLMREEDSVHMIFYPEMYGVVEAHSSWTREQIR